MGKLTDMELRNLVKAGTPIAGQSDGGGLYFTLSKKGTASWIFRYRYGGKQKEFTIGRYPDIPLAEARITALRLRNQVNDGLDIALEKQLGKQKQKSIETLNDIVDEFLDDQSHLKHPKIPRQRYDKHVRPEIGHLPIDRISAIQIYNLLKKVRKGNGTGKPAPTVANGILRFLKRVFNLALTLKKVPFNPAAAFTIREAGGREFDRQRSLDLDEIATFFAAMRNTDNLGRENELAFKLLLVLLVRKNELLQARWTEFNLDAKLWHLPLDRSKTAQAYRIPLPEIAVEWLRELKVRAHQSDFVFPARRIQSRKLPYVSADTLNVALTRVKHGLEHFVVHDLRRTARTHLGRLRTPQHVAELCLNHKQKGIPGIYDTFDYFRERKEALDKWANEIAKVDNGNVISLESAKKHRRA